MSSENSPYVDRVGKFRCVVRQPAGGFFGESGEKKTPCIIIPLEVLDDGDQLGKEITHYLWLSDAAFDNSIATLVKAFPDWDGSLVNLNNGNFTFVGLECEIVTESETYKEKERVKVKWLNAVGGGGGGMTAPMDKGKIDGLLKKLGGKSQAIAKEVRKDAGKAAPGKKAAPKASAPPVEKPSATPPDDDEIPY